MSVANYDTWKASNPADDAEEEPFYECDCCGKKRFVSQCWTSDGLETFACDECRGVDP